MTAKLTFGFKKQTSTNTSEGELEKKNKNNTENEIQVKDNKVESIADIFRSDISDIVNQEENKVEEVETTTFKETLLSHDGEVFEEKNEELNKLKLGFAAGKTKKEELKLEEINEKQNIEVVSVETETETENVVEDQQLESVVDLEKVGLIIKDIEQYDHARQVREYEALSNRKKNLDSSIIVLNIQKQQLEKEVQKIQKEIYEETGIDNIADFAEYVLKSIKENEELLTQYQKEIEEKEKEVKEFKEELERVEQ
jgi:hypothetical protein